MAVIIKTDKPAELLVAIKQAITTKKVDTWSYDATELFTHTPEQWKFKAWFKPKVYVGELRFGILAPKDVNMSKLIYGLYHGRFTEMLLMHFDDSFNQVISTSQYTEPDYWTIK